MIGELPTALEIDGKEYEIRTDFRVALSIFQAYNDPNLTPIDKTFACLDCLYKEIPKGGEKALERAAWFLDGGNNVKLKPLPAKVIDWEQDEPLLFPEINKSAGTEVRALPYLHWWTFLGYFSTMGEGLYSHILNIRQKRAKGKRLEKWEIEFFNSHKEMIQIKEKITDEEQEQLDEEERLLNELLGL